MAEKFRSKKLEARMLALIATKSLSLRFESLWIARAISSLPVRILPNKHRVVVGAIFSIYLILFAFGRAVIF